MLCDLKMRGKLSAKDVCNICWYCKLAGIGGAAAELAMRPDAPSGHYNRHLTNRLKLDTHVQTACTVSVPGHDKYALDRTVHKIPGIPAHESLAAELEESPLLGAQLRRACADKEWNRAYFEHEVVRTAPPGCDVWPMAIYLDSVSFTKRDGLLGWWAYNLVSEKRHLLITLRKTEMCQCGCQGWCSLFVVWKWLEWRGQK